MTDLENEAIVAQFPKNIESKSAVPFRVGKFGKIVLRAMGVITIISAIGAREAKASQPEDTSQKPGQPSLSVENQAGLNTPLPNTDSARLGPDPRTGNHDNLDGDPVNIEITQDEADRQLSRVSKTRDDDPEQDGPEPITGEGDGLGFVGAEYSQLNLPSAAIDSLTDTSERFNSENISIFYTLAKNPTTGVYEILNDTYNNDNFREFISQSSQLSETISQILDYMDGLEGNPSFRINLAATNWGTDHASVTVLTTFTDQVRTTEGSEISAGSIFLIGDNGQEILVQPEPGQRVQFLAYTYDLWNTMVFGNGFYTLAGRQPQDREMVAMVVNESDSMPVKIITGDGTVHDLENQPEQIPAALPTQPPIPVPTGPNVQPEGNGRPQPIPAPEPAPTEAAGAGITPEPTGEQGDVETFSPPPPNPAETPPGYELSPTLGYVREGNNGETYVYINVTEAPSAHSDSLTLSLSGREIQLNLSANSIGRNERYIINRNPESNSPARLELGYYTFWEIAYERQFPELFSGASDNTNLIVNDLIQRNVPVDLYWPDNAIPILIDHINNRDFSTMPRPQKLYPSGGLSVIGIYHPEGHFNDRVIAPGQIQMSNGSSRAATLVGAGVDVNGGLELPVMRNQTVGSFVDAAFSFQLATQLARVSHLVGPNPDFKAALTDGTILGNRQSPEFYRMFEAFGLQEFLDFENRTNIEDPFWREEFALININESDG